MIGFTFGAVSKKCSQVRRCAPKKTELYIRRDDHTESESMSLAPLHPVKTGNCDVHYWVTIASYSPLNRNCMRYKWQRDTSTKLHRKPKFIGKRRNWNNIRVQSNCVYFKWWRNSAGESMSSLYPQVIQKDYCTLGEGMNFCTPLIQRNRLVHKGKWHVIIIKNITNTLRTWSLLQSTQQFP